MHRAWRPMNCKRIGREHDSVAEVDGVEDRGENADVGLGSGDNQALDPTPGQKVAQFRLGKWRIHPLVDTSAGGASAAKGGTSSISRGSIRSKVSSLQRS